MAPSATQEFRSPSKSQLERNAIIFRNRILPGILQQEVKHAYAKRPSSSSSVRANFQIQQLVRLTQSVKSKVVSLESCCSRLKLRNLEKIQILNNFENVSESPEEETFSSSFQRLPFSPDDSGLEAIVVDDGRRVRLAPRRVSRRLQQSHTKNAASNWSSDGSSSSSDEQQQSRPLTRGNLSQKRTTYSGGFDTPAKQPRGLDTVVMTPESPEDDPHNNATTDNKGRHPKVSLLMDEGRRRRLLALEATRLNQQLDLQSDFLQNLFGQNFKLLRLRRAEPLLLTMISVQRKIKDLRRNLQGFTDDISSDSSNNSAIRNDVSQNVLKLPNASVTV